MNLVSIAIKVTDAIQRFSFGARPTRPTYPRWPERGETEVWMRGKIAHFRANYPDQAFYLFDISSADYLPIAVHVASNFGTSDLAIYRALKAENPDLVEQAKQSTGHRWSRSRICDPDDWPDEAMYP